MKTRSRIDLSTACLVVGLGAAIALPASAAVMDVDSNAAARTVSGTGASSRDDNNGGGDANLIGLNTGGIDNFSIYNFDLTGLAGMTATGDATLTIDRVQWSNGNHGSALDMIAVHELFLTNAGWVEGTGVVGVSDNLTDDGSVSFLSFAQFNDDPGPAGGTSVAWQDAGGTDVGNLLGAISGALDTTAGYAQGDATTQVTFTIDQATVQSWIDNGLAGIVTSSIDDGDSRSRFNLGGATLSVDVVPEPGSLALLGLGGLALLRRRRA